MLKTLSYPLLQVSVPLHQRAFLESIVEKFNLAASREKTGKGNGPSAPCFECDDQSGIFYCYISGENLEEIEKNITEDAGFMNLQLQTKILSSGEV